MDALVDMFNNVMGVVLLIAAGLLLKYHPLRIPS